MAASGGAAAFDEHLWADMLSATQRAASAGAVYSIDTGTEIARHGGVEVRASERLRGARERAHAWLMSTPCGAAVVQFVVRVAKALRDKPKAAPAADGGAPKPPVNPFLPYEEALYVRHVVRVAVCVRRARRCRWDAHSATMRLRHRRTFSSLTNSTWCRTTCCSSRARFSSRPSS